MEKKAKILAVDDEAFNLDIISEYLENADYDVVTATDGDEALVKIAQHPDIDVIVLDRMMPRMSGMQVLQEVKKTKSMRHVPVIMQTAAAQTQQVVEGIQAGVFYYLTKPYEEELFLSIVRSAIERSRALQELKENTFSEEIVRGVLTNMSFRFKTLEEAKNISFFVSRLFPDPEAAVYGLNELTINAIEHGNLGITYEEKSTFLKEQCLVDEIKRRLKDPLYKDKTAIMECQISAEKIEIYLKDEGKGFDWQQYSELSPERAIDSHGRGIAMAKTISFSKLEYLGIGNEVRAVYELDD